MKKKVVPTDTSTNASGEHVKPRLTFRAVKEGRTYRVEFQRAPGGRWEGSATGFDLAEVRAQREKLVKAGAGWEGELA